jgi:hypothetical protein
MLDDGICGTTQEQAKRERVNRGDKSQVPRLTLLAPDLVEAILDGGSRRSCSWIICWRAFVGLGRAEAEFRRVRVTSAQERPRRPFCA